MDMLRLILYHILLWKSLISAFTILKSSVRTSSSGIKLLTDCSSYIGQLNATVGSYSDLSCAISSQVPVIYISSSIILTNTIDIHDATIELIGIPSFVGSVNPTLISGDKMFNITKADVSVSYLDFVSSGLKPSDRVFGGILSVFNSKLKVSHSKFTSGYSLCGGAIFAQHANLTISSTTFYNNTAISSSLPGYASSSIVCFGGGALSMQLSSLYLYSSTFLSNTAESGGGIESLNSSTILISSSTFRFNEGTTGEGGGVVIDKADLLVVRSCDFVSNHAKTIAGALSFSRISTVVSISKSVFSNNTAYAFGGGINGNHSSLILENSVIFKNKAIQGGGLRFSNGQFTVSNTNVTYNFARTLGGGISCTRNCSLTVTSSIVDGNVGYYGGGAVDVAINCTFNTTNSKYYSNRGIETIESRGGFLAVSQATAYVYNSIISGSYGASGSHIYGASSSIYVKNSKFLHGYATVSFGIGVSLTSSLLVENCTFAYNKAELIGAAFGCSGTVLCNVSDSYFTQNVAYEIGGCIEFLNADGAIRNSIFFNNSAGSAGVAVIDSSKVEVTDSSFLSNTASTNGGVFQQIYSAEVIVRNCVFSRNQASIGGISYGITSFIYIYGGLFTFNTGIEQGGLFFFDSDSIISIVGSEIRNSTSAYGAVISIQGAGSLTIDSVFAAGNSAPAGGGFLAVFSSIDVYIYNSTFRDNFGTIGGVIDSQYYVTVTIEDSVFEGNIADDFGGALFLQVFTTLYMSGCTFRLNYAKFQGGAISVNSAETTILDTTFDENISEEGGALFLIEAGAKFSNCVFSRNGVGSIVGGALLISSLSTIESHGSTFINNTGYNGGAVGVIRSSFISNGDTYSSNNALRGGAISGQILANISITNAKASRNEAIKSYGSFLYHQNGQLFLESSTISDGNIVYKGPYGAISLVGVVSHIISCNFVNNYASMDGGAVQLFELDLADSVTLTLLPSYYVHILDSYFTLNRALGSGGAIFSDTYGGNVIVQNSTFYRNSAVYGGAISTDDTNTTVTESTFIHNTASNGGGAVFWYYYATELKCTLISNLHENNVASYGDNVATNPISLGTSSSLVVSSSGKDTPEIYVYLLDIYDQITTNISSIYSTAPFVYTSVVNATLRGNTIVPVTLGYALFDGLVVSGVPGENSSLSFYSSGLASVSMTISLRKCVPGEITTSSEQGAGDCIVCGLGTYSFDPTDSECSLCPENAYCPGGNEIVVNEGYWRQYQTSINILQCPVSNACQGGNNTLTQCATGHTGPLCDVCSYGYSRNSQGQCLYCSDGSITTTIVLFPIMIFLILSIIMVLSAYRKKIKDLMIYVSAFANASGKSFKLKTLRVKFKILISFYQIASQIGPAMSVQYPPQYTKYLSILSFLNFNIFGFSEVGCVYTPTFYTNLVVDTVAPFVVVIISIVVIIIRAALAKRMNSKYPSYTYKQGYTSIIAVALYVSYIALSPVSTKIFELFGCERFDDGNYYLVADYQVQCYTAAYKLMTVYGVIMLLLYPIGIPLVYTVLLVSNRQYVNPSWRLVVENNEKKVISEKVLQKEKMKIRQTYEEIKNISFLFDNFKPKRWYFEIFDCFRRLTLGAIPVLILRGSSMQIIIILLLSLLSVAVLMHTNPYIHDNDNRLSIIAQWSITLSLIGALMIRVNALDVSSSSTSSSSSSSSDNLLFTVILILINVTVFALGIASTVIGSQSDDDDSDDGDDKDNDDDSEEGDERITKEEMKGKDLGDDREESFNEIYRISSESGDPRGKNPGNPVVVNPANQRFAEEKGSTVIDANIIVGRNRKDLQPLRRKASDATASNKKFYQDDDKDSDDDDDYDDNYQDFTYNSRAAGHSNDAVDQVSTWTGHRGDSDDIELNSFSDKTSTPIILNPLNESKNSESTSGNLDATTAQHDGPRDRSIPNADVNYYRKKWIKSDDLDSDDEM